MTHSLNELAARIQAHLAERVRQAPSVLSELTYEVAAADLLEVCRTLRDTPELKFEMLMDVCGVDYLHYGHDEWRTLDATDSGFSRGVVRGASAKEPPQDPPERFDPPPAREGAQRPRFAVAYHLLSLTHNWRLRLRAFCADDARPVIESVTGIWSGADWFEREAFDLFGILFRGHPDLRRILTDYGFVGHPFRKDFPLIGNVEVRYDPDKKRVVYQPVSIVPRTLVPKTIRADHRYEPELKAGHPDGAAAQPPPEGRAGGTP